MRQAEIARKQQESLLLQNLKSRRESLHQLLAQCNDHWGYEDPVYRFYHQSFKVYFLQSTTESIVRSLHELLPGQPLNVWFMEIFEAGTGKSFRMEDNADWLSVTRPILEAFFHARYFLEMACRYGEELHEPPEVLPSGWACLLYLYGLR